MYGWEGLSVLQPSTGESPRSDLKDAFPNSNYPVSMVDKIAKIAKVLTMERSLNKPQNRSNSSIIVPPTTPPKTVRIISTVYGSNTDFLKITESFQPARVSSPSLGSSSSTTDDLLATPTLFTYVKRTGSNLRNKFVKVKQMAMNIGTDSTQPCRHYKNCLACLICLTCPIISDKPTLFKNIKPHSGTCVTYNIKFMPSTVPCVTNTT